MKRKVYKVQVNEIQSDHVFAIPEPAYSKLLYADNREAVEKWVLKNLVDGYGHKFERASESSKEMFNVDFTSHTGSVKISEVEILDISTESWDEPRGTAQGEDRWDEIREMGQ